MSIPLLGRGLPGILSQCARRTSRRRGPVVDFGTTDRLEKRLVMSGLVSSQVAVQMLSATTVDSKSVTVDYQVNDAPDPARRISFGIYRSSDARFDPSDTLVGTVTVASPGSASGSSAVTLDENGRSAAAGGFHRAILPLDQGLPPYPEKPYVLVVADPTLPSAMADPSQTAAFRVYTIGVVTHGGIQNTSWKNGPPWQLQIAHVMRQQGFDSVIPYNWVRDSGTPGTAIKQSPKLARMILNAASKFPSNSVVDLELIGHSEGTVVNAYALASLQGRMPPQLQAGYVLDILLDPHAANNHVPGQQVSFAGPLGGLARAIVSDYQARADDPPAFIPAAADEALVFFQHTQASAQGSYNLWGQVPIRSEGPAVHYYNLSAMGTTHSGKTGVNSWFRNFIAPTLGRQAPLVHALELNGEIVNSQIGPAVLSNPRLSPAAANNSHIDRAYGPAHVVQTSEPRFSGTAAPGSMIRLALGRVGGSTKIALAGVTRADSAGRWTLTTSHPLRDGQYRTLVTAYSRELTTRPGLAMVPTQPLGRLIVDARAG